MKIDQQLEVPQQTSTPALDELITRRWGVANIAGGGGSAWGVSTVIGALETVTIEADEQLIRYRNLVVDGTLILEGELVVL